jgi:hypothetical protein
VVAARHRLVAEGQGRSAHDGHAHGYYWADAAASYELAAELAEHADWQPRWRRGLLQRRLENHTAANATFAALLADFTGEREAREEVPPLANS